MRRPLVRALVLVSVIAVLLGAVRLPAVIAPARQDAVAAAAAHGGPSLLDRLKHALGIGTAKQRPSLVDDGRRALPDNQATSGPAGRATPKPPAERAKELAARRQANARFWQLSDGRIQAELSPIPLNYRDRHGQWQPISTKVVPTTTEPGFVAGNQTNRFSTFFGSSLASLLRVEVGAAQLTLGLAGANQRQRVTPTVSGDTVTYPQVRSGVDLVYQVTETGVKERLVLTAPPTDPTFTFTLHTSGAGAQARPDGTIALVAGDGRAVFALPRLFMVDAKDDPTSPYGKAWSAGVTQSLSGQGASQQGADAQVTVRADSAWLASSARVYPVVVDPTIKIQQLPGEAVDAMVVSDQATTNFGSDWDLGVGTTRTSIERSLVQFDLRTIKTGTQIDAADLRLFYDQVDYSDANAVTIEAHRVTSAWAESTVTWNTVSSAVGEAGNTTQTKPANAGGGHWHDFSVKSIVQSWLNGTNPNYGFVLKGASEALKQGALLYEASEDGFHERNNAPMLVVTYGIPGVALNPTTTVHATGGELSWPAYVNTTGDSANDAVEYQVHRNPGQLFKPGAATLVAPLPTTQTSYIDTTATPTAPDNAEPADQDYWYMVAVKTRGGQVIAGPTQRVTVPKAGMTLKLYQNAIDTTLTSAAPATNQNLLDGHAVLEAGNDNTAHGVSRAVVKFPSITGIPTGATVVDAQLRLWQQEKHGVGSSYEAHALSQDFDQATATWNRASTATAWTTPGGDFAATVADTEGVSGQPQSHDWHVEQIVTGWLANPVSNHGLLIKAVNETTPLAHGTYMSAEGEEPLFRPKLQVIYMEKTTEDTYYAPSTPQAMAAGDTVTVPVTVTNTTGSTLKASDYALTYHWTLPDGTDQTSSGNQVQTTLPADLAPGAMETVQAPLKAPSPADPGGDRTAYTAGWDLLNTTTGTYLSASAQVPALAQNVQVEQPTSDQLGLERFYQYAGKNTGAGSTAMVNQHAGNLVWSYNPIANPSRGPATFVRLTHNTLDTSNSAMGFGWSLSAASVMRMGSPLEFHPPGQDWPTTIKLTDGDGTTHTFTLNKHGSTDTSLWDYDHPLGVHLFLQKMPAAAIADDPSRTWVMTRPDRTQFFFDADGYQSATRDKNGNELLFTYEHRKSNNKPIEFLQYLTDAAGRQTLTLTYYVKGQSYSYYDSSSNQKLTGSNLTNPFIIDQVASITDVSGRKLAFTYSDKGLLKEVVDGAGNAAAKTFLFDYDMTQGNKNVKLVKVTDPRGHATSLVYNNPPVDDPQFHWWAKTITDRLGNATSFAYLDPDGPQGGQVQTTVTDARSNSTVFLTDSFGRPVSTTNAKGEQTQLTWDADHNVSQITEANGAVSKFTYDPNTGYPLTITDAQAVHDNTAATVLTYNTTLTGHVADLATKTSPEGRAWAFGHDAFGNLTSVTDPKGTATSTVGDFTTTYAYDTLGQLTTATDANNHPTSYSNYDVVGYPKTITDPLGKATNFVYDARGNVTQITDAKQKVSTFAYDLFGRPLDSKVPKDQANNVFITTPAPVYDANDNVTQATAPNGAVTTAVYDNADQTTSVSLPKDNTSDPARTSTYAYDAVGNLTKQTEPNGTLTTSNPDDFATSYAYDTLNRPTSVTDALGDKLTYGYDNVGNTVLVVDPRKNASTDPNDFTTKYTFDLAHRPMVATDALGFTTSYAYDKDGQVTGVTDKEGHTTVVKRDERAMVSEVDVPHATGVTRVTQYAYDPVGNRTKTITPRGTETTGDTTDFVLETVYDELNRIKAKKLPFSAADPNVKTADELDYSYDDVGNLAKVSAPPSAGQTVRNDTAYSYFDNGWIKSSTDPQDIATTYDYNPLGEQTSRTITSAGGSSSCTQGWAYFGDGTLAAVATTASRSASRWCWSTTPTARTRRRPGRGPRRRRRVAIRATTTPATPPGAGPTPSPGACISPRTAPTRCSSNTPARPPPTPPTPSPMRRAPPQRPSTRPPTRAAG